MNCDENALYHPDDFEGLVERVAEGEETWAEDLPDYRGIRLIMDRSELNARIHRRVHQMVESGLVGGVRNLPPLSPTAEKAIGIREIRAHLRGELTLPESIAAIQAATRQYARRQEKWFKREPGLKPVTISGGDSMQEVILSVFAALPGLRNAG